MKIYHNSQDEKYRFPQGAVKTGERVRLSVYVESDTVPDYVKLRLWDGCERLVDMNVTEATAAGFFCSVEIEMPEKPQLLWYYFIASVNGKAIYYSNNPQRLGGVGVMEESPSNVSYQITVYDKKFKTPDWFKSSVMYQIFPDRFYKNGGQTEFPEKHSGYRIHKDWYEDFFFDRHPFENGPACNDFYGGNLKGIEEKLGYLKDLGISVIYLNPVFEAYSNHRYDTGDYSRIDPILGSEDDFEELCKKAESMGIRIILDGVFSHTGSDSVYFNKYGNYGENTGAARQWESPYSKWYQWNEDGTYNSWWGCSNLPNVNETEPTYLDYILRSNDAIIKKWLRKGAKGWRLDVADELPDEFIKILRSEVKGQDEDAVIIGEVWEDASNKVSYGSQREFLYGCELDSVMNYPFKDGVFGFLLGRITAQEFAGKMLSIMENYPKEALYANMNLLGTHDTMRAKNVLSGQDVDERMSNDEKTRFRLDHATETLAIKRLKLAVLMQMTFVGVPCVYYGDEIGMQGLRDPFNRKPYTWRCIDPDLLGFYKKAIALRNSTDCLKTGDFNILYADNDVLVYKRQINKAKDVFGKPSQNGAAVCCINRSGETRRISFEIEQETTQNLTGVLSGAVIWKKSKTIEIELKGFEGEVYIG